MTSTTADSVGTKRTAQRLVLEGVQVVYNDVATVLRGVDLEVGPGEVVALLGANGAGKTTMLRAITGLLDIHRGRVSAGTIRYGDQVVNAMDPPSRVRAGMAQVMEGRRIFAELTIEENLRTGAYTVKDKAVVNETRARVYDLFPVLKERQASTAGYLSGGEQQMLAIGRAMMAQPTLLLLDEPSLGLAPLIVDQIKEIIAMVNETGTSVLLVEQNATMALSIADRGYILETGSVVQEGKGADLLADPKIREAYLGISDEGRTSFRDARRARRSPTGEQAS